MQNKEPDRRGARFYWLLTLLWMALIFGLTASDVAKGHRTRQVVTQVVQTTPKRIDLLHKYFRKSAHIIEFAILGALAYRAIRRYPAPKYPAPWAWLFATLYAGTDEYHQLLIPGRSGMLQDVLLDSVAAAAAILLLALVTQHKQRATAQSGPH